MLIQPQHDLRRLICQNWSDLSQLYEFLAVKIVPGSKFNTRALRLTLFSREEVLTFEPGYCIRIFSRQNGTWLKG